MVLAMRSWNFSIKYALDSFLNVWSVFEDWWFEKNVHNDYLEAYFGIDIQIKI